MGEFTGISLQDLNDPDPDATPTLGDVGRAVKAGVNDLDGWIDAGSRWLAEKIGNTRAERLAAIDERLNKMDAEDDINAMSAAGRKRINAAVTSKEFWEAPFASILLKGARMSPSLAASVVPALFIPGGAVGATLGAAGVGGSLSAAQVLDEIYNKVDSATDEELQEASSYYKGLRALGIDEAKARRDYTSMIRGNKILMNFAVGAVTNAIGPAGQIARVAKGSAGAIGAAEKGVAKRVGLGAAEGAVSEGVEEGFQDASTQDAFIQGGLQKEFDNNQLVNAVLEGGLLGGVFGGAAGLKGERKAPSVQPERNATTRIEGDTNEDFQVDTGKIEVVEPGAPAADQAEALAATTATPQPNPSAVPPDVAAASKRVDRRIPINAPPADGEVTSEVTAPGQDPTQQTVPQQVADASARIADQTQQQVSVDPTAQTDMASAQDSVRESVQEQAPTEPRAPRILKSNNPNNVPAQKLEYVEPTEKVKGVSKDEKRNAKTASEAEAAKKIFDEMVPDEVIPLPKNKAERDALKGWADAVVQRAKDAGIKIRLRNSDSLPDHLVWLREVQALAKAMESKGFTGKRAQEKLASFLGRTATAKGGDFSVMRSERKVEGEIIKGKRTKAGGQTMLDNMVGEVTTEGNGEIELSDGFAAKEVDASEVKDQLQSERTATADEVVDTAPKGDLRLPEKDAVQLRVGSSAKGPVRGINAGTEVAEIKNKDGTVQKVERGLAASEGKTITDAEEKKRIEREALARLKKSGAIPDNPVKSDKPKYPKAAETKKKVDAIRAEKKQPTENQRIKAETNTNPTPAQAQAGNFAKARVKVAGMGVKVENPRGSIRRDKSNDTPAWETRMKHHHGYFENYEGADGNKLDVIVGPNPNSQHVFVVDQRNLETGQFEKHKVVAGFDDQMAAVQAYDDLFGDGRGVERAMNITQMSVTQFKEWADSKYSKQPAAEADATSSALEPSDAQIDSVLQQLHRIAVASSEGESFTALNGKRFRALRTTSLESALRTLNLRKGSIPGLLRQKLISLAGNVKVHFVDAATIAGAHNKPLEGAPLGLHQLHPDGSHYVLINMEAEHDFNHTIVHEGVHAATMHAFVRDPALEYWTKQIMNEALLVDPLLAQEYGYRAEWEFLAEALSNERFQARLATIQLSDQLAADLGITQWKAKTLWGAVIEAIRRALQLPPNYHTALEAAVRVTDWAMKQNVVYKANWKEDELASFGSQALTEIYNSVTDTFKRAEAQEQIGSPKLLLLRTMDQIAQMSERYFGGNNPVRRVADAIEKMRVMGERLMRDSNPLVTKFYELERKYRGKQWEDFTTLLHDETMAGVFADRPLDQNKHLGKDTLYGAWPKAQHPRLYAAWQALPNDLKRARKEAIEYFTAKQNEMSLGIIKNRVLKALGVEDDALANRIFNDQITEADVEAVGGQRIMDLIMDAKELSKIKGPYVPLMRRGDWVVRATYKVTPPPAGAKQLAPNVFEFDNRKAALAWAAKQDLHPTVKSVWVDSATGERYVKDRDGKEVRITAQDANAAQRFRVTIQDRHVEFFQSEKAALAAAAEYAKDPVFADVEGAVKRQYETNDRRADMMSWQLQQLTNAMERRTTEKGLSDKQKNDLMSALNEASIRMLGSTRIQSRRLPRRFVQGASQDFTHNILDYAQSSANYLAKLHFQPELDQALQDMNEQARKDARKDTSIGMSVIAHEINKRVDQNNGMQNTKTNEMFNRILLASFLDKLVGPSHNIINSLQVSMVTMPVLAGRHGVGRAFTEISKAYNDVAAWSLVKQGARETAARVFGKGKSTTFVEDVIGRLKNKEEQDALSRLVEVGSLEADSGLEIATAIRARDGVGGKIDAALGYLEGIGRQMPRAIETINRTVSALAAYRMERAKGATHESAIKYAQQVVNNTQGQYSNTNAAPLFNHPVLKLSLQFKKFGQMMYHLLGQQIGKAIRNEKPGDRAEAVKTLIGLAATHMAMAGALGLPTEPFKYLLMGLHWAIPPIPGWDDFEMWERELATKMFGKAGGEAFSKGLPRLLGIDLSSRVGLDSLLTFGEPKSDKKNDVKAYLWDMVAGAPGSLINDWVSGVNNIASGNIGKGVEQLVPLKFASDTIRAYRTATEGKKTESGRQTFKPYSGLEAAARAIGFTPAREAEKSAKDAAFSKAAAKEKTAREGVVNQWVNASPSDKAKAFKAVNEFNKSAPPNQRVSMSDLTAAAKRREKAGSGITTTKRTEPVKQRLDGVFNTSNSTWESEYESLGGLTRSAFGYPTDEDVKTSYQYDRRYGDPSAGAFEPGAPIYTVSLDDAIKGYSAKGEKYNEPYPAGITQRINRENGYEMHKAWIASQKSALASLGFDPRRIAGSPKGNEVISSGKSSVLQGYYNPNVDQVWYHRNSPATMVHESIHRGIRQLEDTPAGKKILQDTAKSLNLKNRFGSPDTHMVNEYLVRNMMLRNFGDIEGGGSQVDFVKANQRALDAALNQFEKLAADEIARRRPRGPR